MATNRQKGYEFDLVPDGTPNGGASRSGENTPVTGVSKETPFAIRIGVQRDGGGGGSLKLNANIEYEDQSNPGVWVKVLTSADSNHFQIVDNTGYADKAATTKELSGAGNWIAGQAMDASDESDQITIGVGECTEVQFNVQATSGASGGQQYKFRITDAGGTLAAYDDYPDITLEAGDVEVTPDPATFVMSTTNPTVVKGSLNLTPPPATMVMASVNPQVIKGSLELTPAPAAMVMATVNPLVVLGSLDLTPGPASMIMATVDPDVVLGSLVLSPPPASFIMGTTNPEVVLGSLVLTPPPASFVMRTVDPTVIIGEDGGKARRIIGALSYW